MFPVKQADGDLMMYMSKVAIGQSVIFEVLFFNSNGELNARR